MSDAMRVAGNGGFPSLVFIHRASVEAENRFFAQRAPGARTISDPAGELFAAFGLERGALLQLFGPAVWWRGLRALLAGNFVGRPTGNERQLPGAFLVRGREVLSAHRARHAGDHPDLLSMVRVLDPQAGPPAASGSKRRAVEKLTARYRELLSEARDLQRGGNLRAFAAATDRAEKLAREIDVLEGPRA